MKYLQDVYDFHEKFGIEQPDSPRHLPEELAHFRLKFLLEELNEYESALIAGDLETQHDALIDLVYVALGTALISGFDFEEGWDRVQRANMAKERALPDGSNSTRFSKFDVVKPEGWTPPSHTDICSAEHARSFPVRQPSISIEA